MSVGRFGLLVGSAMLCLTTGAHAISLTQSLDKNDIAYEDHATLEIVVTWPGSQTSYIFDKPLQPQLENLKVQQYSSVIGSTVGASGEVTTKRFSFTLVPTGSGTGRIAPVTVSYYSWPDSVPGQLVTEEMTLHIAAPLPKKSTGGLARMPWWGWALGGVGWLVIVGVVALVVARRRKPKVVVQTPREQFLERLTMLKQASGNDLKRFQTGLFRDLIWYVSRAHGLELAGQSMEQMRGSIESSRIPEAEQRHIIGWLERAEREKFSPLPPSPGETLRLEHEIRSFFEKMNVSA